MERSSGRHVSRLWNLHLDDVCVLRAVDEVLPSDLLQRLMPGLFGPDRGEMTDNPGAASAPRPAS